MRSTRTISWVVAARKEFREFPAVVQAIGMAALTIAAEGGKADIAKPMKSLGSGVLEVAVRFRGNAYRVVYALHVGDDVWVLHAFQKKATQGIKTPRHEIDLVRSRLQRLREMLK